MQRGPMILSAFFFNPQGDHRMSWDIADEMEAWHAAGAADGFALMFPLLPEDWTGFAQQVVPELQRRGLVRTEYGEGTFRERLGLPKPANQFDRS